MGVPGGEKFPHFSLRSPSPRYHPSAKQVIGQARLEIGMILGLDELNHRELSNLICIRSIYKSMAHDFVCHYVQKLHLAVRLYSPLHVSVPFTFSTFFV